MRIIKSFALFESNDGGSKIKTVSDVEAFLLKLAKDGKIYHFDDDPSDIMKDGKPLFNQKETDQVRTDVEACFDVCEKYLGKDGFWDKMIIDVFMGYIIFGTGNTVYVVSGSGGPGNVKKADKAQLAQDDYLNFDEKKAEQWFSQLQEA